MTDQQEARQATDASYAEFVGTAWERHWRLAMLLTGDAGQAEELLQDSLVKVYERWRKLVRVGEPHAYLRRVIVNNRTSMWRRRRREQLVAQVPDRAGPVGEPEQDDDALRQALLALPPGQRAVVVLRHYEDLAEREVADVLGCSVGNVKSQHARALAKLRHLLETPSYEASR